MKNLITKKVQANIAGFISFIPMFFMVGESGIVGMYLLTAVIGVVITVTVLAYAIPVLWPVATTASENITSMTGTDAGTSTLKAFWPIALLIVGLGMAVGVIYFGLRAFGIFGD